MTLPNQTRSLWWFIGRWHFLRHTEHMNHLAERWLSCWRNFKNVTSQICICFDKFSHGEFRWKLLIKLTATNNRQVTATIRASSQLPVVSIPSRRCRRWTYQPKRPCQAESGALKERDLICRVERTFCQSATLLLGHVGPAVCVFASLSAPRETFDACLAADDAEPTKHACTWTRPRTHVETTS